MPRSSRIAAARHHDELIAAAARLIREREVGSVTVPDVMGEVGMTRGGFYKHFESKDALVTAAVDATFREHEQRIEGMADANAGDHDRTRAAFVEFCLSTAHRDDPGHGCPSSLANSMARSEPAGGPRAAFIAGMRHLLQVLVDTIGDEGDDIDDRQDRVLADLATAAGAILLSRATAGDPISDDILNAARRRLTATSA